MRRLGIIACVSALVWAATPQAAAVHLFPLFPGDPTGDCAAGLEANPVDAAATVTVEGFFFIDSSVEIEAGESVTWEWIAFCHSVTAIQVPEGAAPFTTFGGPGSATGPVEGEDELLKPDGDASTYTVTFTVPGTYEYICVHHASVGMVGEVVVTEAPADETDPVDPPPAEDEAEDEPVEEVAAVRTTPELPATGGGALGTGLALSALALLGLCASRR